MILGGVGSAHTTQNHYMNTASERLNPQLVGHQ
jgi:hypothetical protein